jgi:hypothetical protein
MDNATPDRENGENDDGGQQATFTQSQYSMKQ